MPTTFGKYLLLRKLAEGGMAEVFLAKQAGAAGFEKLLVVKRILPRLTDQPEFVRMFVNEARVAARLAHSNIAQIYDLGRVGNSYFIAMEHVPGQDLAQIARRCERLGRGPLPVGVPVHILAKVCAGLHAVHEARDSRGEELGLVHRDVSPQNVVVTYDGDVKLIDFGIAKATAFAGETVAGIMKGKYAYMSPEQCRGEKIDRRSDVFAVGVVLWELVAWKRLFKRDADFRTMRAVVEDPIPKLSTVRPDAPAELDAVVARALERDPGRRYPSCDALGEDLENVARKRGWDSTPRTLARLVRELFVEELAAQEQALREASAAGPPLTGDGDAAGEGSRSSVTPIRSAVSLELEAVGDAPAAADADPLAETRVRPGLDEDDDTASPTDDAAAEEPPEAGTVTWRTGTGRPEDSAAISSVDSGVFVAGTTRRGRVVAWAATALVVAVIAGVAIVAAWKGGKPPAGSAPRTVAATAPPAAAQHAEPPPEPPPATQPAPPPLPPARVVLKGMAGVTVFVDGHRRGDTPISLDGLGDGRPHVLLLVKMGYRDRKVEVTPLAAGEERVVDVALARERRGR